MQKGDKDQALKTLEPLKNIAGGDDATISPETRLMQTGYQEGLASVFKLFE